MKKLLLLLLALASTNTQSSDPLYPAYARIDSRWYIIDDTSNIEIVGNTIYALNIQASACLRPDGNLPDTNTNFLAIVGPNKEQVGFFSFQLLLREGGTGYFAIATTPNVDVLCLGEVETPIDAPSTDPIFSDSFE
jgi:hypothetical protein